jgi:hypothetical protein
MWALLMLLLLLGVAAAAFALTVEAPIAPRSAAPHG